jgi:TonB family protein
MALSGLPDAPNVISRASIDTFMNQERISSQHLNQQDTLRWIGHQFHADRVVFGAIKPEADFLLIKAHLLKVSKSPKRTRVSEEMNIKIPLGNLAEGFTARESFHPLTKRDVSQIAAQVTNISELVPLGIKPPSCTYLQNPPITEAARDARLNGTLIVEAIITAQGTVTEPRISLGLPFGVNQSSLETMKTWKCKPAKRAGVPVAVLVPFDVSFRIY